VDGSSVSTSRGVGFSFGGRLFARYGAGPVPAGKTLPSA
jgi:hypothetical protein